MLSSSRRAVLGALSLFVLGACSRGRRLPPVPTGATVLALGDSLTFGTGAPPDASYPTALAGLTGWNVVNAGVPGDTSAGALARLPGLLRDHAPALVLVGIGGNDFLRRLPVADTRTQVMAICRDAATAGAQPVLIAIPEASAVAAALSALADHPLYEEVAQAAGVPLHAGGWSRVLSDASLRSDAIHGNAQGYTAFARGLAARLRELGLLATGA